ncbi:flagellar basal body rod protein FlgC [Simiduia sp. 21SJ11W-1]|uniref:flagellar basal body rod protein FlgC n=1 Tax=Simiduia sp. 21SJ11W-1 TaxID=2909669 RepID=UPI0020A07A6F|nr:flagellar basal body rod protein FlgC [Simiduia sp. 21SJ11W-1]UTA49460.1 flagellar basal body rod protein FlgC [Simiduia sp. 21SJ11W-1]
MSLNAIFGIAGSGLNAQSLRLNTTASNMANAQSAASSYDQVYRARHPVFTTALNNARGGLMPTAMAEEANAGVQVLGIVESDAPLQQRYEPNHPLANEDGYVFYPNVNVVEEMTNMISATRSFQTNVEVMNSAKQMMQRVLTMGQ